MKPEGQIQSKAKIIGTNAIRNCKYKLNNDQPKIIEYTWTKPLATG
jgi:hypothetical protein